MFILDDVVIDVGVGVLVAFMLLQCGSKGFGVFFRASLGDIAALDTTDDRIIKTNPFTTVLTSGIYRVMTTTSVLSMLRGYISDQLSTRYNLTRE